MRYKPRKKYCNKCLHYDLCIGKDKKINSKCLSFIKDLK